MSPSHHQTNNTSNDAFIHSIRTPFYLRKDDLVLIIVPEELEILQNVDSMLHGRLAYITHVDAHSDEVEVRLKPKPQKESSQWMWYVNPQINDKENNNNNQAQVTFVPKFCLCLQESVLKERQRSHHRHQIIAANTNRPSSVVAIVDNSSTEIAPVH